MSGFDPGRLLQAACSLGLLSAEEAVEAEERYGQAGEARTFQRFLVEEGYLSERQLKEVSAALVEGGRPAPEPRSPLRAFVVSGLVTLSIGLIVAGVLFTRRPPMAPPTPLEGMLPVYDEGSLAGGSVQAAGVTLTKLNSGTPIAAEWNALVNQVVLQPGSELKAQHVERAQALLARAAGTPDEALLKDNVARMVANASDRAGVAFSQTRERAAQLAADDRYAEAWAEWELFPAKLDERGLYAPRIPAEQSAILEKARRFAQRLLGRVEEHVDRGNVAAARAELDDGIGRLQSDAGPLAELCEALKSRRASLK